MTFGSLFAGIGGFDLGFERAGLTCSWQVEIDPYCRRVLDKHWPDVRRHGDVRSFPPRSFEFSYSWRGAPIEPFAPDVCRETTREEWSVDVICGGFPCQDVSVAGRGEGLDGERSGLWTEYRRCIGVLKPRFVVVENSAALTFRGLGRVLGDLAALGFNAEWHCIPAAAFGAPHERDRIWIIAHATSDGCGQGRSRRFIDRLPWLPNETRWNPANADSAGLEKRQGKRRDSRTECPSAERGFEQDVWQSTWTDEPALLGVDDGIPSRVDRVRAIGNAVVPQIAEFIGRRLMVSASSGSEP